MFDPEKLQADFNAAREAGRDKFAATYIANTRSEFDKLLSEAQSASRDLAELLNSNELPNPDDVKAAVSKNGTKEYMISWFTPPGATLPNISRIIKRISEIFLQANLGSNHFLHVNRFVGEIYKLFDNINGYSIDVVFKPSVGPWEQATDTVAKLIVKKKAEHKM